MVDGGWRTMMKTLQHFEQIFMTKLAKVLKDKYSNNIFQPNKIFYALRQSWRGPRCLINKTFLARVLTSTCKAAFLFSLLYSLNQFKEVEEDSFSSFSRSSIHSPSYAHLHDPPMPFIHSRTHSSLTSLSLNGGNALSSRTRSLRIIFLK